jgi:hypothetical protein
VDLQRVSEDVLLADVVLEDSCVLPHQNGLLRSGFKVATALMSKS